MSRRWSMLVGLVVLLGANAKASGHDDAAAVVAAQSAAPAISLPRAEPKSASLEAPARGERVAAVFGSDDRIGLPSRYNNLRHVIGLLFNVRARMVCTAFCVGEDVIATAAHCLYKTRGEPSPTLEEFLFSRFADTDKKPTRLSGSDTRSTSQYVVAGSERLSIRPPIDATSDWAVVRLARPVCSQGYLTINPLSPDQIAEASQNGRLYHVAYHRDVPNWQLAYSTPCTAGREFPPHRWRTIAEDFSAADNLILHTCDTGGASSGSPLLIDGATGPEVVGINVGTYVVSQQAVKDGVVVRRYRPENVANTAVAARALVTSLEALRSAVVVGNGGPMQVLQSHLKTLKLYSGGIDGRYGPEVKRAIEAFEQTAHLPVTGLATRALLNRLDEASPLALEPGSRSAITTAAVAHPSQISRRRAVSTRKSDAVTPRRQSSTTLP